MDPEFPPVSLDTLRLAGTFSPGDPPDGYLAAEAMWKASWRKDADELEKKGELDQAERLRARVRYWEARAKLYTEERLEAERPARIERMLKRLELAEAGKESPKGGEAGNARRGRLPKDESEAARAAVQAAIQEHPTLKYEYKDLGSLAGVSESTARRIVMQMDLEYKNSKVANANPDEVRPKE